jgi:hypothetical protein
MTVNQIISYQSTVNAGASNQELWYNILIVKDPVNPIFPVPDNRIVAPPLEIENAMLRNKVLVGRICFPGVK